MELNRLKVPKKTMYKFSEFVLVYFFANISEKLKCDRIMTQKQLVLRFNHFSM